MNSFNEAFPYSHPRMPVMARNTVSASQPLAAQAGLRMLLAGGNAVDAALASAITLTVVEPTMNGIGGDLFALVWHEGELLGLNSTGHAPAAWTAEHFAGRSDMPKVGWDTVTVPGQVAGWRALSERLGRLPFARLFEPAIDYAERGFQVTPQISRQWAQQLPVLKDQPGYAAAFAPEGRAPRMGETWRFADQARSLRLIAESKGDAFYTGALAQAIVAHARQTGGALTLDDLAAHRPEWVEPISRRYRDHVLHEIPPSGQGIAALIALGLLEHHDIGALDSAQAYHLQIEAMKLAFADLNAHVGDPRHMASPAEALLDDAYLAERSRLIVPGRASAPVAGTPRTGGTVYLAAADASGTMVSFIQSNYRGFGSGVVVPGTGISLHNRGEGFNLKPGHANCVAPGKKPLHSIIPGFITRDAQPVMAFGVMGGSMQAQGHVQMTSRLADFGQNPQAMCDAPRWRVEGTQVSLESHADPALAEALRAMGHAVEVAGRDSLDFGSAQLIQTTPQGYVAASDPRRDGQAVGF
ncbi:gamma-glutamyltransferase family protein [Xylophilus sp. GOD-11R]|uniref:gamma-glutamyltransferase family protein n=1 Tax=Xylophilus sp. GOD-11R TaxID=3089814 RepID=UPI00298C3561|nr:gamma-glutamyltransferase family protein [Xylophilus sp. GOD-11R]WPB55543.1 gamma-glutamyltransferase family protein [Xylophilus sp. GOD-11R]